MISQGDRVVVADVESVDPEMVGITGTADVQTQALIWIESDEAEAGFYGPYRATELEVLS